ncbi:hypothetical protein MESS2_1640028 [Mesorhizobium metallidurans STM 2683]|uniref:Uncharacterized protein n=1 Tax=Mesorhizobium metallidurans STM 2683 TaxID=1297569 RepID=M5ENF0_9HYPH|nr:hypothetical protein [Mesorhizobium metallidurans]CCV05700.1 hypothetical protein MESS2_1640028 [Mesorhizobium metallidurans STM 2683]
MGYKQRHSVAATPRQSSLSLDGNGFGNVINDFKGMQKIFSGALDSDGTLAKSARNGTNHRPAMTV